MFLYVVSEQSDYVDFSTSSGNRVRENIGRYTVVKLNVDGWKDVAKKFSNWEPEVIENCVFDDEGLANRIALERTIKKLTDVLGKVSSGGRRK